MNKKNMELRENEVYKFVHKGKGTFIAQVIGFNIRDIKTMEKVEVWDSADPIVVTIRYDVRVGTDQYNMSLGAKDEFGKMAAERVSNIRPSRILAVEHLPDADWKRPVKTPKSKSVAIGAEKKTVGDRIKAFLD